MGDWYATIFLFLLLLADLYFPFAAAAKNFFSTLIYFLRLAVGLWQIWEWPSSLTAFCKQHLPFITTYIKAEVVIIEFYFNEYAAPDHWLIAQCVHLFTSWIGNSNMVSHETFFWYFLLWSLIQFWIIQCLVKNT